jgi:hypothetical protein
MIRLHRTLATAALLGLSIAPTRADHHLSVRYEGKDGPGKGKHIVLVSGDEEYRSEEALPMLGKILCQEKIRGSGDPNHLTLAWNRRFCC